jgi:coenzyme F420 hydrogenase subunit beta
MTIHLANGEVKTIGHLDFWAMLFSHFSFFSTERCVLCSDSTSEFADVSFGTAWLPELKNDKNSLIILRTEIGRKFLELAKRNKIVNISEISPEKVVAAESEILYFTKEKLAARLTIAKIWEKAFLNIKE